MTQLHFKITFHSVFRVGLTTGSDGTQILSDHREPIPADHLKGLIAHTAKHLVELGKCDPELCDSVFGTTDTPSPWFFSAPQPTGNQKWQRSTQHRVAIDQASGAAIAEHLVQAENTWAPSAEFSIVQIRAITEDPERHCALLRCAASGVKTIGGWRRRGLGVVTVTPHHPTDSAGYDLAADIRKITNREELVGA